MAIVLTAIGERAVISVVAVSIEHPAGGAVLRYAVAAQIGQVSFERRALSPMPHHAGLDGNAARPIGQAPRGRDTRRPTTAESSAPPLPA